MSEVILYLKCNKHVTYPFNVDIERIISSCLAADV